MIIPVYAKFSCHIVTLYKDLLAKTFPGWYSFQIKDCGKYLGFWLGPASGTKEWHEQIAKWQKRSESLHSLCLPPHDLVAIYNTRCCPVLDYVSQLKALPKSCFRRETFVLTSLLNIPGQALSKRDILSLHAIGGPKFRSVEVSAAASMARAASKTLDPWMHLLQDLQRAAMEGLPMLAFVRGCLSPPFFDSEPIVLQLYKGLAKVRDAGVHVPLLPLLHLDSRPTTTLPALDQKIITPIIRNHCVPNPVAQLVGTLKARLRGAFEVAAADLDNIEFEGICALANKLKGHVVLVWFKTLCNAWCTSCRFHEKRRFPYLFGCPRHIDAVQHYIKCPILFKISSDAMSKHGLGGLYGARNPSPPTSTLQVLGIVHHSVYTYMRNYMLFTIYHATKKAADRGEIDDLFGSSHFSHDSLAEGNRSGVNIEYVTTLSSSAGYRAKLSATADAMAAKAAAMRRVR